ncbi:MAG: hypothetical protein GX607_22405 [Myxococcales bacterium]|nr:hypothetical protein [Myxococcales bacterium]
MGFTFASPAVAEASSPTSAATHRTTRSTASATSAETTSPKTTSPNTGAGAEVDLERARELFAAGKTSMEHGDWREAARRFREAAIIKDTPGLRYHIAYCEENAEQLLRARVEYEAAGRLLEALPAPDVEGLLGPALARVAQKIPEVRLELTPPAEVTLVSVDGQELADWRKPVELDPGRHWVQVEARGYRPATVEFTLERGQKQALWVRLQPEGSASPPHSVGSNSVGSRSAAPSPEPPRWRTPVLVTGGAVSLAGLGLGVWALLDRSVAIEEAAWARSGVLRLSGADGSCEGASGALALACDDLAAAERRRDRANQFAIGGFALAGVGAALTFTSLLVGADAPLEFSGIGGVGVTGMRVRGRF